MRVALLTNILAPYRLDAFRALAETPGWQLRVFVNAEREFDRHWQVDAAGLDVETLPGARVMRGGRTLHFPSPWRFFRALRCFRPDAVVSAELGARTALAWLFCLAYRVPLMIWAEPTRATIARGGWLRRCLGPFLLARARSVIVPGSEARRALLAWGVPEDRLFVAPNCHDVAGFEKELARIDPETTRLDLHAGLGCRPHIALVVGRLLRWKGVKDLLAAWDRLPPSLRREWTLLFVGEGREENRVDVARSTHPPGEMVHIPRATPRELAELYGAADLLVFPSLGEPWGMVVNEAMACRLPVVCSLHAGCAEDLVRPGRTGWRADPRDEAAFRDALLEAMTCDDRARLGEQARAHVAAYTPGAMAEGFRAAIRQQAAEEPVR